jgi:hypothetical protein
MAGEDIISRGVAGGWGWLNATVCSSTLSQTMQSLAHAFSLTHAYMCARAHTHTRPHTHTTTPAGTLNMDSPAFSADFRLRFAHSGEAHSVMSGEPVLPSVALMMAGHVLTFVQVKPNPETRYPKSETRNPKP